MTVGELIKLLADWSPDTPVKVATHISHTTFLKYPSYADLTGEIDYPGETLVLLAIPDVDYEP